MFSANRAIYGSSNFILEAASTDFGGLFAYLRDFGPVNLKEVDQNQRFR